MTSYGNFWFNLNCNMIYGIVFLAADFVDVEDNFLVVSRSHMKSGHVFSTSELPTMEVMNLLHCFDGKKFVV